MCAAESFHSWLAFEEEKKVVLSSWFKKHHLQMKFRGMAQHKYSCVESGFHTLLCLQKCLSLLQASRLPTWKDAVLNFSRSWILKIIFPTSAPRWDILQPPIYPSTIWALKKKSALMGKRKNRHRFWEIWPRKKIATNAHQHSNQYFSAGLWSLSLQQ